MIDPGKIYKHGRPVESAMMRLTATVSGRVQRVGYRAKVLGLAKGFGLTGMVQNRPDGRVLIIAEGPETDLERFTYAVQIKNTLINVQSVDSEITPASGAYQDFRKITGSDEVGERLDDGIEILKEIMLSIKHSLDKQG
jgi:acylphosphatase